MKYIHVDSLNTFMRCRHAGSKGQDLWSKIGMSLHVTITSINAAVTRFGCDHVVFAIEGRSWRKDFYERYKANRLVARQALTEKEADEDKEFFAAYQAMIEFLVEHSSCSVIGCKEGEADDVIARFIALHPEDDHVIISSDSDYIQLLAPNVSLFNGVADEYTTVDGVFKTNGKPVIDKATKAPKVPPNPKWALFEKCMRGDSSDNVFSAFPGVRIKSTKNKVGLEEAFADFDRKGYAWNNVMLQRWVDHNEVEHRVLDDYNRNVTLIDLTAQPDNIKELVDRAIRDGVNQDISGQVGLYFMKFCGKYELTKLADNANAVSKWLIKPYSGKLLEAK